MDLDFSPPSPGMLLSPKTSQDPINPMVKLPKVFSNYRDDPTGGVVILKL
jgi:hypothetical protein